MDESVSKYYEAFKVLPEKFPKHQYSLFHSFLEVKVFKTIITSFIQSNILGQFISFDKTFKVVFFKQST